MLLMELGSHGLTDGDAMFTFIECLKPVVLHQVHLYRPYSLANAVLDAKRMVCVFYFSAGHGGGGNYNGPVPMELWA